MKKFFMFVLILGIIAGATYCIFGQPAFLACGENKEAEDIPKVTAQLTLESQSALLIDMGSGKALFKKNSVDREYPASTTKIMTALIVLEHMDLGRTVVVGEEANMIKPGSSIAGLDYGEEISVEDLLYGLLLPSGNDAAYVLAVNTARAVNGDKDMSIEDALSYFVGMMNEKARDLGAADTHFESPDGTYSASHYTTAKDLAVIATEAVKNSTFRSIAGTTNYSIKDWSPSGDETPGLRNWVNTNKLIQHGAHFYKFATGVKTGHTERSGYCLVASAESGGRSVMAVLLNSTEDGVYDDAISLFDAVLE